MREGAVLAKAESSLNLSNTWRYVPVTSFSYVLLRLNRRLQTESTAPFNIYKESIEKYF